LIRVQEPTTIRFGSPHRHFETTDSTNERAKFLAETGAPGGLVVTAGSQVAGRGRRGRSWFAGPGSSLLYSALLRPLGDRPLLPLLVPLAVCDAAEELGDRACKIKWPNDVWVDECKLAGVLIEGRPDADPADSWAVIGIGLNLDLSDVRIPDDLEGRVTWLGRDVDQDLALERLNRALESWLAASDSKILEEFRRRDLLVGRDLEWDGGSGTARGIDDLGHLLVETGNETIALGAGEVSLGANLRGG
jgi:BirA family biotin operon repressor/biotin-[acetyl-CoA-carboxylase] ligase